MPLINAVKEQQQIIEKPNTALAMQAAELEKLKSDFDALRKLGLDVKAEM